MCDKVEQADLVVEVQFQQKAVYPPKYREKQWAPPEAELVKTAKTGVVSKVFKGSASVGDPWLPAWGVRFYPGGSAVLAWENFFALDTFTEIYFLKQAGDRFATTGWAEESAGCGSSAHRSWCDGYREYQTKIAACLKGS